jgi:tyrosine-protein kinase Etk/Wzc
MKNNDILSDLLLDGFVEGDSDKMNFKSIIFQYLKYWWLFAISVLVFGGLTFLYIFFSTPMYAVYSSIMIKVDKSADFSQNIVFSELEGFETTKQVENEIEILGSYSLMRDAIEELPFETTFFVEDKYSREREIYGSKVPIVVNIIEKNNSLFELPDDRTVTVMLEDEQFQLYEDEKANRYSYGDTITIWYGTFAIEKSESFSSYSPKELKISFNNKDQIAGTYSSRLRVALSSKFASVLSLSLMDAVPEKGKDVLTKVIEIYNNQAVKEKNTTAENTIAFIDNQLSTLVKEVQDVESQIEAYKRQNNISDLGVEYTSFVENSKVYDNELSKNRIQIEVLESIEAYLDDPAGVGNEVPSTLSIQDATLTNLITKFNELQSDKVRISRTVQPNSPILLNLEDELSSLRRNIKANISNIKNGLEINNRNLSQNIRQIDGRISRVPEIERGLLELTRIQNRKQDQFLYLQAKREESELSLAATTVANARVIDAASAGGSPAKPNKPLLYGLSLMISLGLPFAFVYLKNNLSTKILQKSEIKEILKRPILAEISHNSEKNYLVINKSKRSPLAEQIRLARTNLSFLTDDKPNKTIMVTSSISGEGKTFLSLNLAVSLSLTGKKVVILEFDLRKPALFDALGLSTDLGISDYLSDASLVLPDVLVQHEDIQGLSLISCGTIPEDPSELMLHERVDLLIGQLKEQFDYVIIDTAPIGTVSDGLSLAPFVDVSLFVVRYNYTTKENLNFIREMELHTKLRKLYIVANDAKIGPGYYGYAYGYGYENIKKSKKKIYS